MKMVLAVYDLFTWGPTFNIFEFLTSAKLFAEKKGAARIDFCLIKRSFRMGAAIQPQDIGAYEFRISDIVLAALPMFPILHSYILDDEQFNGLGLASKYDFVFPLDFSISLTENKAADELRYVRELNTENHLSSATFPSIIVPRFAYEVVRRIKPDAAKNLITITLRGATFQKAKNSDRFVWSQVAEYFRSAGYDVITIPDVESVTEINGAADPLGMLAMANQSYRCATYDAACLNLCVNNGANASLWYNGNARMLVAKMFTPGTNSEESVSFKNSGVDPRKGALTKSPWHDFIFNAEDKGG